MFLRFRCTLLRAPLVALPLLALLAARSGLAAEAVEPPKEGAAKPLPKIELVEKGAFPLPAHLEQRDIAAGIVPNNKLLEAGGDLFHARYNGFDGVGAMRTAGGATLHRFSNGPSGGGQPITVGAQSCGSCHGVPFAAGAGLAHTRVFADPNADGISPFNARGTTSLHGNGLLQLLAQEMTEELQATRDAAATAAKKHPGEPMRRALAAKGVDFGALVATADASGNVAYDLGGVVGVDPDLVVRPFGWKGFVANLRNFVLAAANAGMGMQGEEFAWRLPPERQPDADEDGVARELSVGDITAMTIYNAAQETPHSAAHLAALGMVAKLDEADAARVERGQTQFARIGCASCHQSEMRLGNAVFEEPTRRGNGAYLDHFLVAKGVDYDPDRPVRFDLLTEAQPPRVESDPAGGARVRLYGDLKRHRMGRQLADPAGPQVVFDSTLSPLKIGEEVRVIPVDEFLTAELWGVGSTALYLHDDRAGSLAEAIALHGEAAPPPVGDPDRSEAQEARDAFLTLSADEQVEVVTFLKSLVNFSPED